MDPAGIRRLVFARQWQGTASQPLSPEKVFEEIALDLKPYRVTQVSTDQWAFDALSDVASRRGLLLTSVPSTSQTKIEFFSSLRAWMIDRQISLLDVREIASDLKRVQRRVTQTGLSIELPLTGDGRHCDYAAMLAVLLTRPMAPPDTGLLCDETYEQRVERLTLQALQRELAETNEENDL
jgi:hypothetical protein